MTTATKKKKEEKKYEVIEIKTYADLPVHYMMFPDNVGLTVKRIDQIEEKLFKRGRRVIRPLKIYRLSYKGYVSLAVELEMVNEMD